MRLLAALLAVTTLSSCIVGRSTHNEPLDREAVAGIQPGVTTAKEVVAALGAPGDVVQLGLRSAYRYDFVATKRAGLFLLVLLLFNEDKRSDRVWVFFDEGDVVTHLGKTFQGNNPEYAMPWEDLHE